MYIVKLLSCLLLHMFVSTALGFLFWVDIKCVWKENPKESQQQFVVYQNGAMENAWHMFATCLSNLRVALVLRYFNSAVFSVLYESDGFPCWVDTICWGNWKTGHCRFTLLTDAVKCTMFCGLHSSGLLRDLFW